MAGLRDGEKSFENTIIRFDSIHERDGWMDTARRQKPRLHSIARQKSVCISADQRQMQYNLSHSFFFTKKNHFPTQVSLIYL